MPQRDVLRTGEADRAGGVAVVEGAGERDHADPHGVTLTSKLPRLTHAGDPPVLDHRVGQELARDALEGRVVDRVVDLELEVLALAHVRDAVDPEAGERTRHGLPLRVEDLRLRHHVHHHSGHGCAAYDAPGFPHVPR